MAGSFKQARTIDGCGKDFDGKTVAQAFKDKGTENTKYLSGQGGDPLKECVPSLIPTATEVPLKNENNAWIILGRDRPGSRLSGYGGRGDTQAAAIDIVVGRMGDKSIKYTSDNQKVWANPSFKTDAARIYISQKTDVDANFGLTAGQVGTSIGISQDENTYFEQNVIPSVMKPTPRSAIALKADGIRLIAREGIKLVTRTDAKNSQGGTVQGIQGIDIIAGNDDKDLQPMVKGDNLQLALERLVSHVTDLNGIVDTLLMHQMTLNKELTTHFHFSPFFGASTTLSPSVASKGVKTAIDHLSQTKRSLVMHKTNLALFSVTYLNPTGDKYINSRYNNTN